jgi:peptide/nickel transport system substrate-binding protein
MKREEFITALAGAAARLPLPLWVRQLAKVAWMAVLGIGPPKGRARLMAVATAVFATCLAASPAAAQKRGGTLNVYISANPSSLSILEEVSFTTVMAAGPIFNGLVVFDPMKPVGGMDTVIPELAESWAWDEIGTRLTFKLRQGVKWHDGRPFTAKDVQCTWHWLNG